MHSVKGRWTVTGACGPYNLGGSATALLDSGSMHNFINVDLLRRLHLSTAPHPTMRVLVANDDRVPCEGVARDVALAIGT